MAGGLRQAGWEKLAGSSSHSKESAWIHSMKAVGEAELAGFKQMTGSDLFCIFPKDRFGY